MMHDQSRYMGTSGIGKEVLYPLLTLLLCHITCCLNMFQTGVTAKIISIHQEEAQPVKQMNRPSTHY